MEPQIGGPFFRAPEWGIPHVDSVYAELQSESLDILRESRLRVNCSWGGRMDELRIAVGGAIYLGDFDPPLSCSSGV